MDGISRVILESHFLFVMVYNIIHSLCYFLSILHFIHSLRRFYFHEILVDSSSELGASSLLRSTTENRAQNNVQTQVSKNVVTTDLISCEKLLITAVSCVEDEHNVICDGDVAVKNQR